MERRTAELAALLGDLIRNRCVSSGFPSVGEEHRNVDVLRSLLESCGADVDVVEPIPGRPSLMARLQGSDPSAPAMCLLGHTDVVPADAEGWRYDPFGGELVDGEVWGRGAVDMLHQTAAMALVMRDLARSGRRPAGDVLFWAAPDEECGGHQGVRPVLAQWPDLIRCDVALTEVGGAVTNSDDGPLVEAYTADKGTASLRITVRGTQAHSSMPYGVRNPVVLAAEVVRRIASWEPTVRISAPWRAFVTERYPAGPMRDALLDEATLDDAIATLGPHEARHAHACTRCTVVPTVIEGGDKVNTIPAKVRIAVNVRHTWDDDIDQIVGELRSLLADLVDPADVQCPGSIAPTQTAPGTELWGVLSEVTSALLGSARLLPTPLAAQTDARWLRPMGTTVYGFNLLHPSVSPDDYWSRFHGVDERVDVASLGLMLQGYEAVVHRFAKVG